MHNWFERAALRITGLAGSFYALLAATALIVAWLVTGPLFNFSDTWQLVINTTTTIITFLMVFIIQSSTNREAKATQLKLDELIRALQGARNELIGSDKQPTETLAEIEAEFQKLAERGGVDTAEEAVVSRQIEQGREAAREAGTRDESSEPGAERAVSPSIAGASSASSETGTKRDRPIGTNERAG